MNNKLTLPELISQISSRTSLPKSKVEEFLKDLIAVVSQSLSEGESVRIKGIGTFKVTDVEPRRSVHVATGENIEIPGYRKVSFSPSGELADAVNEPFAAFSAVEIGDDVSEEMLVDTLEENSEETLILEEDTLQEEESLSEKTDDQIDDTGIVESPAPEVIPAEKVLLDVPFEFAESTAASPQPSVNTPSRQVEPSAPEAAENNKANIESFSKKEIDPYYEAVEEEFSEPLNKEVSKKNNLSGFNIGLIVGLLSATCLIFISLAVWRAVNPESYTRLVGLTNTSTKENNDLDNIVEVLPSEDSPMTEVEDLEAIQEDISMQANTEISDGERLAELEAKKAADEKKKEEARLEAEKRAKEKEVKKKEVENDEKVFPKPSGNVYDTISKTRYLTTMAKEHYGNYHLWPYIYEENKAILGHPDRIRPGTKVVIPPLSKYGVNPANPADIAAAKQKGAEIYSRYK